MTSDCLPFSNWAVTTWPQGCMTVRKICSINLLMRQNFRISALQQLLQIYQATSDWQKAIDVAERLVKLGKDKQRGEIAQFLL